MQLGKKQTLAFDQSVHENWYRSYINLTKSKQWENEGPKVYLSKSHSFHFLCSICHLPGMDSTCGVCQGLIQHTGLDPKSLPQFLGGDRTDGDFPEVLPVPENALKFES